ncbi:MAG: hypothetical protein EP332_12695 [Bacteroidetes bacterium]|nr:MAG: hypothetical protein EP332_12695 [Bacteroidota bacterium]
MRKFALLFSVIGLLLLEACQPDNGVTGEAIPNVPVNITVNLDLPNYTNLKIPGAFMYFEGGARGVVVIHNYDGDYYAFDRNCSFQPSSLCAQLWVDSTVTTQMKCGSYSNGVFEKCCDSRFELPSGFPLQGPAVNPMRNLFVSQQGNTLYITN